MAPKFSAVIPAYNAAATLRSAVGSVIAQTSDDFELIVVDDGSTDATPAITAHLEQADPRIRVVRQDNQGLAAARNTGIAHSSGRYVSFLDSDDLWMPDYLREMGEALDSSPDAGLAYTDGWVLDDESKRIRRDSVMARQRPPMPPPQRAEDFLRELVARNFIPAEVTARRAALEEVGVYKATLPAVEDYELCLRMVIRGFRAVRAPGLLFIRRDLPGSMSKDPRLMYEALREVMSMVAEEDRSPRGVSAAARRRITELDRELAMLDGRHRLRRGLLGLRRLLGALKRWSLGDRLWHESPPPEVATAFPDLERA